MHRQCANIYFFGMATESIESLIQKFSPLMETDSEIFRELAFFFGNNAKVQTHRDDLSKFLGRKRLYQVLRFTAPGKKIDWEQIEFAEIALGKELTTNAYGWMPDAWTAFEGDEDGSENSHRLVAILAFDYGD